MNCPKCSQEIGINWAVCPKCGERLPNELKCQPPPAGAPEESPAAPSKQQRTLEGLHEVAERGDVRAQLELAGLLIENGDEVESAKWYERAAEQGHPRAQRNLGQCYYEGNGVPEDLAKAIKLFRQAAEQGDTVGQFLLGECLTYGDGIAQDEAKGITLVRKAAMKGHADAQFSLGLYYYSLAVPKDEDLAARWFRKAAKQGHETAQEALNKFF